MKNKIVANSSHENYRNAKPAYTPRFLILDDDAVVTRVFSQHIRVVFPDSEVSVSNKPEIQPGYDIYFIDNDFDGEHLALDLVQTVREQSPHALVVALSSTLSFEDLQRLVNRGCNAVYNKRFPHQSEEAKLVIENYIRVLKDHQESNHRSTFMDLLNSLKNLLAQWNQRLGSQVGK